MIETTFSVEHDAYGAIQVHDLKPAGRDLPVTEDNKREYVRCVRLGRPVPVLFPFPRGSRAARNRAV